MQKKTKKVLIALTMMELEFLDAELLIPMRCGIGQSISYGIT